MTITEVITEPAVPVLAHRDDILAVGWLRAAVAYPQFRERQVISANSIERLRGRRIRRVFLDESAFNVPRSDRFFDELHRHERCYGTQILPAEHWAPDVELDA